VRRLAPEEFDQRLRHARFGDENSGCVPCAFDTLESRRLPASTAIAQRNEPAYEIHLGRGAYEPVSGLDTALNLIINEA
jgi:hypothetical protein